MGYFFITVMASLISAAVFSVIFASRTGKIVDGLIFFIITVWLGVFAVIITFFLIFVFVLLPVMVNAGFIFVMTYIFAFAKIFPNPSDKKKNLAFSISYSIVISLCAMSVIISTLEQLII